MGTELGVALVNETNTPTPSINPSQVSARHTKEGARFDSILFATLDALVEAKLPFGIIGGVAVGGLGRPRSTHDIDIFVRPEDAESIVQALEAKGFRIDRINPEWIFKAFKDDILVDVIFRSAGDIYFDEEMHQHCKPIEYHGRKLPLVSPEDLIIIKCAVHFEGGPHHWHDALTILSHATIDWNYLLHRARRAPRRLLSLLLYAQSNDMWIPNSAIQYLFKSIFRDESVPERTIYSEFSLQQPSRIQAQPQAGTEEYLIAHIREALAEDPRTATQDLRILIDDQRIVVKGETISENRVAAILDVIQSKVPGREIVNHLRVTSIKEPERIEEIS